MCGIVGIWSRHRQVCEQRLTAARDTMHHRGPDDGGIETWPEIGIGLGHRRLAIIDISSAGHQPFATLDGKVAITFNGEIYNFEEIRLELLALGHTFRSKSDTEVILNGYLQWGDAIVCKLQGMFAFCIAERDTGRLFLARDRAGEKPLFYYWNGNTFLFGSELKAILAWPEVDRIISIDAFNSYLAYGYVPGGDCIVQNVRKLPAGHTLEFLNGRIDVKPYWSLFNYNGALGGTYQNSDALVGQFETLLAHSVRQQLMSDVPLGVLLSGGLDSSLITALAAAGCVGKLKTFTISFPGYGTMDEGKHARLIANAFGTEHYELEGTLATPDLLEALAAQFDEPMADSSMIPTYMVSQLVRKYCTVALGGDGGDELFGGYPQYPRILLIRKLAENAPRLFNDFAGLVANKMPTGMRGRNYLSVLAAISNGNVPFAATQFDFTARKRILSAAMWHQMNDHLSPENTRYTLAASFNTDLSSLTGTDFLTYLPDDILVKVDRASMLNSLEVRAPFLDYKIVEFAFRDVPDNLKVSGKQKKILLKRLAKRLLPPAFEIDRKQGFSIPLGSWLRTRWRKQFMEYLSLLPPDIFQRKGIESLWVQQGQGRYNSERVFALALFALWMKGYKMSF
jgi:asparagine synthase (glutamine-hydrolysing)